MHKPFQTIPPLFALCLSGLGCGASSPRGGDPGDCPSEAPCDPLDVADAVAHEGGPSGEEAAGGGAEAAASGGAGPSASDEPADGESASSGGSGGAPAPATSGPHFAGTGDSFRPLTTGCGPETASMCTGACEQGQGASETTVLRPPATLCFSGEGDATPEDPSVVIEQVLERKGEQSYAHIRVTFDPSFTDNTYGEGSVGWSPVRGHRFSDLTGSDHTELQLTRGDGQVAMSFKIDLLTQDADAACGHGTLGVSGGDGDVLTGDAAHVLAVATSLDRNLNGCGYCAVEACGPSGDCTEHSPATDADFTPNASTPDWDYRQVYEMWIDLAAFGEAGFGQAFVTYTHSSPAKGSEDTLQVEPSPCPPEWDEPYCPPSVLLEGGDCFGSPPGGGDPGDPGDSSNPDEPNDPGETCPPNEQVYIVTEGASLCTPIPYTNNPDHEPCPAGYALDLVSEGQYCLPL